MLVNPTLKRGVEWRENQNSIALQQTSIFVFQQIAKKNMAVANLLFHYYSKNQINV
jgi:hypothetical protein